MESLTFPPLPERPFCTIVIPCWNEEAFIEGVVRAAMAQRWPPDRLEILVVDGRSADRTRAIVAALRIEDERVVLIDNPERLQSAGMNRAIRRARGDVIVRMDAHAEYADDFVAASVEVLRATGAANAGGAARARARTPMQAAVAAALGSPLGVGGSAYRDPDREGPVESVWGGAFRREVFEHVGVFDAEARTNEDAELNQRIILAGGIVYLSRSIVAHYYPRDTLRGLALQYFEYGAGRARTLLRRRRVLSPRPLVPFAAVTGFALLALLAPASALPLCAVLALYACVVFAASLRAGIGRHPSIVPLLFVVFPVMHAAHGLGVWAGLARHARRSAPGPKAERPADSPAASEP